MIPSTKDSSERKNNKNGQQKDPTQYDILLNRIKNHKLIVGIILFCLIVIGVANFTSAIDKIMELTNKYKKAFLTSKMDKNLESQKVKIPLDFQKIRGVLVIINYTIENIDNVNKIKKILLDSGAEVKTNLYPSKSYPKHKGMLYYHYAGEAEALESAYVVKGLIADIEAVEIKWTSTWFFENPHELKLWVVSK